jgi:predicted AAA+ superfamily ATPase
MSYPKKVYACDTGLVSALSPRDGANLGHKLENLVYLKLLQEGGELSYFADDADSSECDFVQEHRDGTFTAVQVAWELSEENEDRELAGAACAMDRFGLKEAVLVTHAQSDLVNMDGRTIKVVPGHEYLLSGTC